MYVYKVLEHAPFCSTKNLLYNMYCLLSEIILIEGEIFCFPKAQLFIFQLNVG